MRHLCNLLAGFVRAYAAANRAAVEAITTPRMTEAVVGLARELAEAVTSSELPDSVREFVRTAKECEQLGARMANEVGPAVMAARRAIRGAFSLKPNLKSVDGEKGESAN